MSTVVDSTAYGSGEDAETMSSPIVLHDPEVTKSLDALFARYFGQPRRSCLGAKFNHALKRALDIIVSVAALVLLWPVIIIGAIATWVDTGRPLFYSQIRRVRFGRNARIYKLRTLVVGTDRRLSALVNIKHGSRYLNIAKDAKDYTRVGRVLERLWVVELPQLWNVLRGQMSLVGNRPLPDYVINTLRPTTEVVERFASPQGLTGYVQIIGRDKGPLRTVSVCSSRAGISHRVAAAKHGTWRRSTTRSECSTHRADSARRADLRPARDGTRRPVRCPVRLQKARGCRGSRNLSCRR